MVLCLQRIRILLLAHYYQRGKRKASTCALAMTYMMKTETSSHYFMSAYITSVCFIPLLSDYLFVLGLLLFSWSLKLLSIMPPTTGLPPILHTARDCSLIVLSLLFLPFSVLITTVASLIRPFIYQRPHPVLRDGRQITVLVTGVGMAKGLFLARAFHIAGCRVIAADFEKLGIPVCGRFSASIARFYGLRIPSGAKGAENYFQEVVDIIRGENVDAWVSCSGVATAMEDGRAMQAVEERTSCKAFQFDEDTTFKLDDKFEFMKQTDKLGLLGPKWYSIQDMEEVPIISQTVTHEKTDLEDKYIVKSVRMDDQARGVLPILSSNNLEQLTRVLSSLDYSGDKSWILQEYIEGGEEYCTHSVVVDGQVKAFLACPSSSVLLHYQLVDEKNPLFKTMLQFTQRYADGMFRQQGRFTGHLSFDFLAQSRPIEGGVEKILKPIECNPRCHTATIHLRGSERTLVNAYLSCLTKTKDEFDIILPAQKMKDVSYYWAAHDLIVLFLLPSLSALLGCTRPIDMINLQFEFWRHVLLWKDPTFEWWDPLPWLALYHICWPCRLAVATWRGMHWSQLNVSTMKIFFMQRQ